MDSYPDEAWSRVGRMLVSRRPRLDPRYRTRKTFAEQTGLPDKTIQEIENAYRSNFSDQLLATIEGAYRLAPGSIRKALADPSITDFESKTPAQRLGEMLPTRRIELDPRYAKRAAFAAAVGLDEAFVEDVEYGRIPLLDDEQQAAIEGAYRWAPGSVASVLAGRDPVPLDVRRVSGAAYLAATTSLAAAADADDLFIVHLSSAPADVSEDVKALWNNYSVEQRVLWHLPIPLWEREYLLDHLTAVREALRKARAEQRGSNGEPRAS